MLNFLVKGGYSEGSQAVKVMRFDDLSPKEYEGKDTFIFNRIGLKISVKNFGFSCHANEDPNSEDR